MPTPKGGYHTEDKERAPGTTGIIGRFKDSGALIQWGYKTGREHERLAQQGKDAPTRLYQVTEEAADIGTMAHDLVEKFLHGEPMEVEGDPERVKKAHKAFGAFDRWFQQSSIQITETEMQLVSEQYRYGGTPDAIGVIDNLPVLLDWKTSKRVYPDHLIQLAAYGHLLKECRGIDVQEYHLLRFDKTTGDFAHHSYTDLTNEWEAFKLMRRLYDLDKLIKERA